VVDIYTPVVDIVNIYTPVIDIYTPVVDIYTPVVDIYTAVVDIYTPVMDIHIWLGERWAWVRLGGPPDALPAHTVYHSDTRGTLAEWLLTAWCKAVSFWVSAWIRCADTTLYDTVLYCTIL
jgi:hypothetical protein